jgi:hypothetical protein
MARARVKFEMTPFEIDLEIPASSEDEFKTTLEDDPEIYAAECIENVSFDILDGEYDELSEPEEEPEEEPDKEEDE